MSRTNITALKTIAGALVWLLSLLSVILDFPSRLSHMTGGQSHDVLSLMTYPVWMAMGFAQWISLFLLPFWIALIIHQHRYRT